MARGGARQGVPGRAYSNRTDLMTKPRDPNAAPAPGPTGAVPVPANATQQGAPLIPSMPLDAPTARPGEHVMSGVNQGPGPTAQQAGLPTPSSGNLVLEQLKAYYAAHPDPSLGDLIEAMQAGDFATGGLRGRSLS